MRCVHFLRRLSYYWLLTGLGRVCGFIRALDDTVSWLTASKIGLCCCVVATLRLVVVAVSVAIVVLVVGCGQ